MKVWEKPKLLILTRSDPQEAVLSVCKIQTPTGAPTAAYTGPDAYLKDCMMHTGLAVCNYCSTYGDS